jgi:hypothetical protein
MRGTWKVMALLLASACQPESSTCILNIGNDITNFTVDGYNQVVRLSTGSNSWSWGCPGGGSAQISGTVSSPTSVTYNLTWTFSSCAKDGLTLTGTLQDSTTNGSSASTKSQVVTSSALTLLGTVSDCNADPIDATCVVDISFSDSTTIEVCGLTYP